MATLAHYEGGSGYLVDSNVWIDCMDSASPRHDWAIDQLQAFSELGSLHVNALIYAELVVPGTAPAALDAMLDIFTTLRSALPWASAALAAQAFQLYRARGGTKIAPLPDFFIEAHAAVNNLTMVSRDTKPYRSYFGKLRVIAA
ncbi:MAG: PIN domain-containing protein [Ferruginibacter sp.]|nr:PIN domain-containing protein [Rhodoferax sp.]